jgi:hypothetical protein
MANLDALFGWFDENRDTIIHDHYGERVLIKDNAVIGYYPDIDAALVAANKRDLELGNFLVQRCLTQEEDIEYVYTVTSIG